MKLLRKSLYVLLLIVLFGGTFVCQNTQIALCSTCYYCEGVDVIDECYASNFPFETLFQEECEEEVYLGGSAIGMTIDGDGVTVVGMNEFVAKSGYVVCPAQNCGVAIGDIIVELDGKRIYSSAKLGEIAKNSDGKELAIKIIRGGQLLEKTITPQIDITTNSYRLGLWTKDSSSGIGTLTFVRKNLQFASLGHPICDSNGNIVSCKNGGVFKCNVYGVKKGVKGLAGELNGSFEFENKIGHLTTNNKYGVYGSFSKIPDVCSDTITISKTSDVKIGRAQILSSVSGKVEKYDVEIVKVNNQFMPNDKSMVIHVTDNKLIELSGGIVQGMSGSPIIQNGKLVGAVTHVFVNDPTRGYGIFAQWMLQSMGE